VEGLAFVTNVRFV